MSSKTAINEMVAWLTAIWSVLFVSGSNVPASGVFAHSFNALMNWVPCALHTDKRNWNPVQTPGNFKWTFEFCNLPSNERTKVNMKGRWDDTRLESFFYTWFLYPIANASTRRKFSLKIQSATPGDRVNCILLVTLIGLDEHFTSR